MKTTKLKQIFSTAVAIAMIAAPIAATPEITIDGAVNAYATKIDNAAITDITSIKMNIEGEVADGINANAVLQIGSTTVANEVYLTFDNIADTLIGDLVPGSEMFNFKTILGKKALKFGTEGDKYFNETQFIGKSLLATSITGANQTTGEGVVVDFELPTPAPINLSLGAFEGVQSKSMDVWANGGGYMYSTRPVVNARLTTELEVSDLTINLGASTILSALGKSGDSNKNTAVGVDAGITKDAYSGSLEFASVKKDNSQSDTFYVLTAGYELNETYSFAARYAKSDFDVANPGVSDKIASLIATKTLSDTSRLQVQYDHGDTSEKTIRAQIVVRLY